MQTYSYNSPMARLSQLQVTLGGSSLFNRSYGYDAVGNVQHIMNNVSGENQVFGYDSLDRLSSWSATNTNQLYGYDAIGNLTNKNGTAYAYGSNGNGTGAGPHQARSVGGQQFNYDANGNLTSDGSRSYTWNAENQLTAVNGTATESYTYDGDGQRATRTVIGAPSTTTIYLGPLYEMDVDGNNTDLGRRSLYQFGGQVIAQRSTATGSLIYLHGDHLGSVSVASDGSSGALVSSQEFDPWGAIRSGSVPQTKLNYTGQRRDDTGLLYYGARYYNPALARFISADTVVPGSDSVKGLIVDYHEAGYVSGVAQENALTLQKGFYFQLNGSDKKNAKSPMGPGNPQALNRYSYVLGNPLRYTDPTGHWLYLSHEEAVQFIEYLKLFVDAAQSNLDMANGVIGTAGWSGGVASGAATASGVNPSLAAKLGAVAMALLGAALGAAIYGRFTQEDLDTINWLIAAITANNGPQGVIIGVGGEWNPATYDIVMTTAITVYNRDYSKGYYVGWKLNTSLYGEESIGTIARLYPGLLYGVACTLSGTTPPDASFAPQLKQCNVH